jgi:hypothetical protein
LEESVKNNVNARSNNCRLMISKTEDRRKLAESSIFLIYKGEA